MVSLKTIPWQTIDLTSKLQKVENLEKREKIDPGKDDSKDIKETCAEFESLFIYFIMKTMRDTIPKSGLLDGGMAEKAYISMLDQELSRKMAMHGGIGLSSLLLRQLDKDTKSPEVPDSITDDPRLPLPGE